MAESSDRMKTGVGGPGWRVPDPFPGPPVRMPRWSKASAPTPLTLAVTMAMGLLYLVVGAVSLVRHGTWSSGLWAVFGAPLIVHSLVQLRRCKARRRPS